MQVVRNEIRTGLLVVFAVGLTVTVLLLIGAPGVFTHIKTYKIYFDNAGGVKQGALVMLAGRKVGQITKLISPVPNQDRPKGHPKDEVLIEVEVEASARIYKHEAVTMLQSSLLGDTVIDFSSGDEHSGLAPSGFYFIGVRQQGFAEAINEAVQVIRDVVTPVAAEAQGTIHELGETAKNLKEFTAPGSNLDRTLTEYRDTGQNLARLSGSGGALDESLHNVDRITGDLTRDNRIPMTLQNLENASHSLNQLSQNLDATLLKLSPNLTDISTNARELTDTLKRQPWRLIYPSTVRYPSPTPTPARH